MPKYKVTYSVTSYFKEEIEAEDDNHVIEILIEKVYPCNLGPFNIEEIKDECNTNKVWRRKW